MEWPTHLPIVGGGGVTYWNIYVATLFLYASLN